MFNVENLVDYKGTNFNPNNPLVNEHEPELVFESAKLTAHPNILPNTAEKVDKILDDKFIAAEGETRRNLIH